MPRQSAWLLALGLGWALVARSASADPWKYVVPPAGDPFEHPPMRALALAEEKPADLEETVSYRGSRRQYARIHFGSPSSCDAAIVLDHVSDKEIDLYLDNDRNRVIEPKDRVTGQGRTWRAALDAVVVRGDKTERIPRTIILQLGRNGRTLQMAACGYLEGTVSIGTRSCKVRRTDGDGNGLFSDPQDRLWLDLDGNGSWDAIEEQFLFTPILVLGGVRYVVRSDEVGNHLALEQLQGTGTVKLALAPDLAPRVTELTATLIGRDGSVVTLHGNGDETVLPVGDYRTSAVTIGLRDSAGGTAWSYVFSGDAQQGEPHWYKLTPNSTITLDPIGKLGLVAVFEGSKGTCRPGQTLQVQPCLHTADGLVIANIYRGQSMSSESREAFRGQVSLTTREGAMLDNNSTGFG